MKKMFLVFLVVGGAGGWYYSANYREHPPEHHLAAGGAYFLLKYFSITTAKGVVGWTPGQEVHASAGALSGGGKIAVTDGKYVVLLPESLLTRDIEDAEVLRNTDDSRQDQARGNVAFAQAENERAQLPGKIAASKEMDDINSQAAASSVIGTYNTRLHDPAQPAGYGGYFGSGGYYVVDGPQAAAPVSGYGGFYHASAAPGIIPPRTTNAPGTSSAHIGGGYVPPRTIGPATVPTVTTTPGMQTNYVGVAQ